jgi:hypothetical protein
MQIRRLVTIEEQTLVEGMKAVNQPVTKVAALAVITNPFAGRHVEDLSELVAAGAELGALLVQRILRVVDAEAVESYGKACIVGEGGEIEHSAALLHPSFGKPVRQALGGGAAIIPSTKKTGGPGTRIDLPLHHKNAALVVSHFDAMEVGLPDAPKADEILLGLAVATGGRPHARVPGLAKGQAVGDGLR